MELKIKTNTFTTAVHVRDTPCSVTDMSGRARASRTAVSASASSASRLRTPAGWKSGSIVIVHALSSSSAIRSMKKPSAETT